MTKSTAKGAIQGEIYVSQKSSKTKQNIAKQNQKSRHTEVEQDATGNSAVDGLGGLDLTGL